MSRRRCRTRPTSQALSSQLQWIPLPALCVGVFIAAHGQSAGGRAELTTSSLKEAHDINACVDVVASIFRKLEAQCPEVFRMASQFESTAAQDVVFPFTRVCCECKGTLYPTGRLLSLHCTTTKPGARKASAKEAMCRRCDLCFAGHWFYRRTPNARAITTLRLAVVPSKQHTFLIPFANMTGALACEGRDLLLLTGLLHHCRGSFRAAMETFNAMRSPMASPMTLDVVMNTCTWNACGSLGR